jgi:hypothetical protein
MATYLTIKEIRARVKGGELPLFRPGEIVSLDEKKVSALIKAGKLKLVKPETARIEPFCRLCSEVVKKIDAEYYPQALGWISWLKKHHINLWEKIEKAKGNLESPLERGINLKKYSNLVQKWETLLRQAIESYLKDKPNEEYEEMLMCANGISFY